jgi:dipeptidyl aminopeptidase/acylaminoacyl peptidase
MRRPPPTWGLVLVLAACEARISSAPVSDPRGADAAILDAAGDATVAPTPDATVLGPWGPAIKVTSAESAAVEDDETLSANALEMVFAIDALDGTGKDLYYTSRASLTGAWTTASKLVAIDSTTTSDETPRMSADDKTLYFASGRAGNGTLDIYQATRAATGSSTWTNVQPVDGVSTKTLTEKWFMPCGTDHYLMVQNAANGTGDIFEGTIGGALPAAIPALNTLQNETGVFVTQDCLTVYFQSARVNPTMIYTAHRASLTAPWSEPAQVTDFAAIGGNQEDPWLSPDGHTFAFVSDAAGSGNKDVYLSTR